MYPSIRLYLYMSCMCAFPSPTPFSPSVFFDKLLHSLCVLECVSVWCAELHCHGCSVTLCSCHGIQVRAACIRFKVNWLQWVVETQTLTRVVQAEQVLVVAHARLHAFERWRPHRVCSILQQSAICCNLFLCIAVASQSTESIIYSYQSHLPCDPYTLLSCLPHLPNVTTECSCGWFSLLSWF